MYCEGTVGILDENDCRAATHVFIYTHTPSAADSLRPRDGTQWFDPQDSTGATREATPDLRGTGQGCDPVMCWERT